MAHKTERPHGNASTYANGCRCDACRAAWAAYMRARRERVRGGSAVDADRRAIEDLVDRAVAEDRNVRLTFTLTPLAAQILARRQASRGLRRSEVVDELLRNVVGCQCDGSAG